MKKYFQKAFVALLALVMMLSLIPIASATAPTLTLSNLKYELQDYDENGTNEYVYHFETVSVSGTVNTIVFENPDGVAVILPSKTSFSDFDVQDFSDNSAQNFKCVAVPDGGDLAAYIQATKFVLTTPDTKNIKVVLVEGDLKGNAVANPNMGYWNGHYYELITEEEAIKMLIDKKIVTRVDSGSNAHYAVVTSADTSDTYYNSDCYVYQTGTGTSAVEHLTWEGARAAAQLYSFLGMQGYLATIEYKGEQTVLVGKLNGGESGSGVTPTHAWVGGHYKGPETTYYDGSTADSAYYATSDEAGWYWVTEPGVETLFLAGEIANTNYSTKSPMAGYGTPVKAQSDAEVLDYWSTDESGVRTEPNNSTADHTTIREECLQITNAPAWNDLMNTSPTPAGIFVEYSSATGSSGSTDTTTSVTAPVGVYDVTFDLDNGTIENNTADTQKIAHGRILAKVPTVDPTRDNYTFGGWYNGTTKWVDEKRADGTDGSDGYFDVAITENITLTAKWIPYPEVSYDHDGKAETDDKEAIFYPGTTVYIDPQGGSGAYSQKSKMKDFSYGGAGLGAQPMISLALEEVIELHNPQKAGYTFSGWTYTSVGEKEETVVTFKATWVADAKVSYLGYRAGNDPVVTTAGPYGMYPDAKKITINLAGGSVTLNGTPYTGDGDNKITLVPGQDLNLNPDQNGPAKENFVFNGWELDANDTFTAQWIAYPEVSYDSTDDGSDYDAPSLILAPGTMVTINTNGGTGSGDYSGEPKVYDGAENATTTVTLEKGKVLTLNPPTKGGHAFKGWVYTEADNTFTASWVQDVTIKYLKYVDRTTAPNAEGSVTVSAYPINTIQIQQDNVTSYEDATLRTDLYTPGNKTNETFWGWSYDENDRRFTGHWVANPTVTYTDTVTGLDNNGNYIEVKNTAKDQSDKNSFPVDSTINVDLVYSTASGTYTLGNGSPIAITTETNQIKVKTGEDITFAPPTCSGQVFMGWDWFSSENTLKATWQADAKGGKDANGADIGDKIPDAYQIAVPFKVIGGTFANGSTQIVEYATLTTNGAWDVDGKGEVTVPTGMLPAVGYKDEGSWTLRADSSAQTGTLVNTSDVTVSKATLGDQVYVYEFVSANALTVLYQEEGRIDPATKKLFSDLVPLQPVGGVKLGESIKVGDTTYDTRDPEHMAAMAEWKNNTTGYYEIPNPTTIPAGKVFAGWNLQIVGTVYELTEVWEDDTFDAAHPTSQSGTGDGIPDKYQKKVTFQTVNGKFANSKTEKVEYVTLTNAAGTHWSITGSATVEVPTGMKPDSGYTNNGAWDGNIQKDQTTVTVTGDTTFTYTFPRRVSSGSSYTPNISAKVDKMIPGIFTRDHIAYISGYEDGTVRPNAKVSRGQMATMLYNLLNEETRKEYFATENAFTDMTDETWCNTAVSTMTNLGLLAGYNDGTFGYGHALTRAQFATILSRLECEIELDTTVAFTDIEGHWAEEAILLVAARGWVGGYEDGSFNPDAHITRAQAVTILNNMLQRNPETIQDLHRNMKFWVDNSDPEAWYYIDIQEASKDHNHSRHADGTEARK